MEMRNRWFSHYLYGVENGVERDARVMVVREGMPRDTAPTPYADYPNPEASAVALHPALGGGLTMRGVRRANSARVQALRA